MLAVVAGLILASWLILTHRTTHTSAWPETTALQGAAKSCELTSSFAPNGDLKVSIATWKGDLEPVACVLSSMNAPDNIAALIGSTSQTTDPQTASWDDVLGHYTAHWVHQPRTGDMNMTVTAAAGRGK